MNRSKFYTHHDMTYANSLQRAEEVINNFNHDSSDYYINDIIEFYNITKFIKNKIYMNTWSEEFLNKFFASEKLFNKNIFKFFSTINDSNFIELSKNVSRRYKDDFISLIKESKRYKNINFGTICNALEYKYIFILDILKHKELVNYYDHDIKDFLLSSGETPEILLDKYVILSDSINRQSDISLPSSLSNEDKENIINNYIDNPDSNIKYIKLMADIKTSKEFSISAKTKLKAKRKYDLYVANYFKNNKGIKYEIEVKLDNKQEPPVVISGESLNIKYTYSQNYLENNLNDSLFMLYKFSFIFGYIDLNTRISMVNLDSQSGIFEKIDLKAVKTYTTNNRFFTKQNLSTMQMVLYYNFMLRRDIRLESLIEYIYNDYMNTEFKVNNFRIMLPSASSNYLEKCRSISPEIESILKQFNQFVNSGEIDHDLLQMEFEAIRFNTIKSLVDKKYIYVNKSKLSKVLFNLFSDQSMLSYIADSEYPENTFYELIDKNKIKYNQIDNFEKPILDELVKQGYVNIDDNTYLSLNKPRVELLYQLYNYEVINYYRVPKKHRKELDLLIKEELVYFENTLFSKPEQDYFDYLLNNSKFNNALALRNNYLHATQSGNDQENYMIFLKILILITIKINDDLCIFYDNTK